MSYKTILVYLSAKRRAEAILEPAIRLTDRSNAHLIGMHVYAGVTRHIARHMTVPTLFSH